MSWTGQRKRELPAIHSHKNKKKSKTKRQINEMRVPQDNKEGTDTSDLYTEKHLQGMQISHAVSDFGKGSTTTLTRTDHSILNDEKENKRHEFVGECQFGRYLQGQRQSQTKT